MCNVSVNYIEIGGEIMKKNFVKLLTLAFVASLSLTFAACGSKETSNDSKTSGNGTVNTENTQPQSTGAATTESKAEESAPAESQANGLTPLEEFLATPEAQSYAEEFTDDTYAVELDSENGNILVFRFILKDQVDLSDSTIKDQFVAAMDQSLEAQSSTMSSMVAALASIIGEDDLVIRFQYLNADDSEIFVKDFE